jgi:hypothetical protein
MKINQTLLLTALLAGLALPLDARAQSGEFMEAVRQGGGWVEIPITGGEGGFSSEVFPTLGLTLAGCLNVWWGHSGRWEFDARDPVNDGRLRLNARPGEGVPFSYRTGIRSSLDVRVRWSEPEDTTLVLWVGLDPIGSGSRDACEPVYGSDGDER